MQTFTQEIVTKDLQMNRIQYLELTEIKEYIKQCNEIFEQQKQHDNAWCKLRIIMGYSSIILLLFVIVISSSILMGSGKHSEIAITGAAVALFTDIIGLITSVWKIVLNPNFVTKLQPTINNPLCDKQLEKYKNHSPDS